MSAQRKIGSILYTFSQLIETIPKYIAKPLLEKKHTCFSICIFYQLHNKSGFVILYCNVFSPLFLLQNKIWGIRKKRNSSTFPEDTVLRLLSKRQELVNSLKKSVKSVTVFPLCLLCVSITTGRCCM